MAFTQNQRNEVRTVEVAGALSAEPGMKQQTHLAIQPAIAFSCKDHGADAGEVAPTLRSMGHDGSHANGGGQVAVAYTPLNLVDSVNDDVKRYAETYAIQAGALRENPASGPDGVGVQSDHAYTLEARSEVQAVAFRVTGNCGAYETGDCVGALTTSTDPNNQVVAFQTRRSSIDLGQEVTGTIGTNCSQASGSAPCVAFQSSQSGVRIGDVHATLDSNNGPRRHNGAMIGMQVRRLTPVECARLQGFPDFWTRIPWRGKPAENCPDGPQYKALGNSWAVPVVRWIGTRILAECQRLETLESTRN